jgi:phosphate transport system substrate-binding protein
MTVLPMNFPRVTYLLLVAAVCVTGISCSDASGSKSSPGGATSATNVKLQGAGASFPAPLYERWFNDYNKLHPEVRVNYQGIGSGGGITQLTNKTVDFAASDAAMTDEEISKVEAGVQLLPMTAGSVVLGYNLPGGPADLKLTREAYTGIFLGKITKWNDPLIAKANGDAKLPDTAITVVWRADSSGTTFVFTNHLSAISPEWKSGPGTSKSVKWPCGIGGKQNDGVAATITQTPGAIGYLEYGFAQMAKIPMATIENKSGRMIKPDLKSAEIALASVELPEDLRVWLPDPEGSDAYPIVSYTWLLCYKKYEDPAEVKALKDVIKYCLSDGQKISGEMGYVALPEGVVTKVTAALDNIKP